LHSANVDFAGFYAAIMGNFAHEQPHPGRANPTNDREKGQAHSLRIILVNHAKQLFLLDFAEASQGEVKD